MASSSLRGAGETSELPMYDPIVEMAKKEKSRRFAEKAVHVIPVVLLVCGLILWFFCNPHVEVGLKREGMSKFGGLTIEGDIDNDSDGTQTGFLPVDAAADSKTKPLLRHNRKLYILRQNSKFN
ncbi:hypothetical protein LINGRAHAP2_LOCUS29470 [Linum grandiflorum]